MNQLFNNYRKLFDKMSFKLLKCYKNFYNKFKLRKNSSSKKIVFICGCQRSGTTLMTQIFERDFNTKVYGEFSELSSKDVNKIRLNTLKSVKNIIEKNKVDLIVLKPLVESQNILYLLEYFNKSRSIWMYRNYKDVAFSNINRFGVKNGIKDLTPIVENQPDNWRSENVSKNVREIIVKYFHENMNPLDAAALFWFVRNRFFFELRLDLNPNVLLLKYEEFVSEPGKIIDRIYQFLDVDLPVKNIIKKVHSKSINRGGNIILSREIDCLCNQLLNNLDSIYRSKNMELSS